MPVGGYYTIDAQVARDVVGLLKPDVVVPMHYRTRFIQSWPIATVDAFVEGQVPGKDEEAIRKPSDDEPFCALAFKVMTDAYVGRVTYFRVYSGVLTNRSYVYNATRNKTERIQRLLLMHANHREDVEAVSTGDIVATVALKNTVTGDTLCDEKHPIILERISFPTPVITVAIEAQTRQDLDKLGVCLSKLAEEDPTFTFETNDETGQTLIAGMGELHLEIICDRLLREFGVSAVVGKPQVAYKESILAPVSGEGRFVRQTGGRGQYGHVKIKLEPLGRGQGFEFENAIRGGVVPQEFIPAVEAGIKEALASGSLIGYPLVAVSYTHLGLTRSALPYCARNTGCRGCD